RRFFVARRRRYRLGRARPERRADRLPRALHRAAARSARGRRLRRARRRRQAAARAHERRRLESRPALRRRPLGYFLLQERLSSPDLLALSPEDRGWTAAPTPRRFSGAATARRGPPARRTQ